MRMKLLNFFIFITNNVYFLEGRLHFIRFLLININIKETSRTKFTKQKIDAVMGAVSVISNFKKIITL